METLAKDDKRTECKSLEENQRKKQGQIEEKRTKHGTTKLTERTEELLILRTN